MQRFNTNYCETYYCMKLYHIGNHFHLSMLLNRRSLHIQDRRMYWYRPYTFHPRSMWWCRTCNLGLLLLCRRRCSMLARLEPQFWGTFFHTGRRCHCNCLGKKYNSIRNTIKKIQRYNQDYFTYKGCSYQIACQ